MSYPARTRRRLLVGAVLAGLWVLVASYLLWQHRELVDRIDRGFGEPFAVGVVLGAAVPSEVR